MAALVTRPATPTVPSVLATPWDRLADAGAPTPVDKRRLLLVSRTVERRVRGSVDPVGVYVTLQHRRHLTARTLQRYRDLAAAGHRVVLMAEGLTPEPSDPAGLRRVALDPQDPLTREWDIVVVGRATAYAFAAADRGDAGPDLARRFDWVTSTRTEAVVAAARTLVSRASGLPWPREPER